MREGGYGVQKHSEVRPQGGQVYNYKALQRVAGEPAVLQIRSPTVSNFFNMIQLLEVFIICI